MSNKKFHKTSLERMMYVSKYKINETPKYKTLMSGSEIDALPEYLMKEADAAPSGATPTATGPTPEELPTASAPAPDATPAPAPPASGATPTAPAPAETPLPEPTTAPAMATPMAPPAPSPAEQVAAAQLNALRLMSAKLEDLGAAVDSLNGRMEVIGDEVEQVREPSDMEKFDARKIDSSPYYFNLNDLWDGNNFKARMDQFSKGYVKTDDGYVADFDELPKLSPHEVKASFDPQ